MNRSNFGRRYFCKMDSIFSPIQIGSMILKNRFVRSATQDWLGDDNGRITDKQIVLYKELAVQNVGMIISAHAYVEHPRGRASLRQNGIYNDCFIGGYRELVNTVRPYGAKLIVQVAHSGVQTTAELTEGMAFADPNYLSTKEIEDLIEAFAQAVRRVKQAGCDGAQIHMAHGYLISRFLSPKTNLRLDEWGGSLTNRVRIANAIVKRSRELVGWEFPLLVKLNSCGGFAGTAAIEIEEVVEISRSLEAVGIDGIEISGGAGGEEKNSTSRVEVFKPGDEAYFLRAAERVKNAVHIPVILVGGVRSRFIMEKMITEGLVDMISLCRPFICEPDLVTKMASGTEKVKCISCNKCRNQEGISCILQS